MRKKTKTAIILSSAIGIMGLSLGLSRLGNTQPANKVAAPIAVPVGNGNAPVPIVIKKSERRIQVALLLDTSSSMDGLIAQAKTQLWKVVNEASAARHDGAAPIVEIAIYEYGKSSLSADGGYIRQVLPFTTDLDRVSEELFALNTNGGDEYAGQVIQSATRGLAWSENADDLKLVFIAGNEEFTQGPVHYEEAISEARAKGIRVNAIHCGGDDPTWRAGAAFAKGEYMMIDHNAVAVHIQAPQDDEIARLGVELNSTYIAYGARGRMASERQLAQDANAEGAGAGVAVQRSISKSSANYKNAHWDLVDGLSEGAVDLDDVPDGDLPENMRSMSLAEREAFVAERASKRTELAARIQTLNIERDAYVATKRAEMGEDGANTLDTAMLGVIHKAGSAKGYTFE